MKEDWLCEISAIDCKYYSLGSKQRLKINLTHAAQWMCFPGNTNVDNLNFYILEVRCWKTKKDVNYKVSFTQRYTTVYTQ